MNKDIVQGNWKKLKGSVEKQWGKLTGDMLDQIDGDREKLLGEIQRNYGVARDEAERQVRTFEKNCGCEFPHRDAA